jgi:hypothetical protein
MSKLPFMMIIAAALTVGCTHSHGEESCEHCKTHAKMAEESEKSESKTEKVVTLDQVPDNVKAAYQRDFPNTPAIKIEKETYKDGTVQYEFKYMDKEGKKQEVEYNPAGEKLEEHEK